eukprot:jgi/Picre1/27281/NNA_000250.t1
MLVSKEDEIERMVQNAQSASESLATEKESLANELDQVSEEKALLMQKVSELQDKLQGDASLQEAAAEKDGMISRLQTDLDQFMINSSIAQSKAEQLEADLVDAGNVAEEAITQREEISLKLQALSENYEALRLQKDGLAEENENLRSQVESLESSAPTEKIGELADALSKRNPPTAA